MIGCMADVDLVDETFIVAPPEVLAPIFADPQRHRIWWPDLTLTLFMDRGLQGQRWSITGSLIGSAEIWLETFADGCIVHHYLRGAPSHDGTTPTPWPDTLQGWRQAAKSRDLLARAWKSHIWELKREVEGERPVGLPA